MYKFIAIDLDGTLLNSNGEVSIKNKEAIKKACKKRNNDSNCFTEECHNL